MSGSSSSFTLLDAAPGPDDPFGMLRACHRRLEARLDTLERVLEVYQQADEERYDQAAGALGMVIRHFLGAGKLHTEDEELSLFPRLTEDEALATLIDTLEADHAQIEAVWRRLLPTLEELSEGADPHPERVSSLADGVAALCEAYRAHILREDREIFPLAEEALSSEARQALGQEMAARRHLT